MRQGYGSGSGVEPTTGCASAGAGYCVNFKCVFRWRLCSQIPFTLDCFEREESQVTKCFNEFVASTSPCIGGFPGLRRCVECRCVHLHLANATVCFLTSRGPKCLQLYPLPTLIALCWWMLLPECQGKDEHHLYTDSTGKSTGLPSTVVTVLA
jgi:hypothetical protein